MVLESYSPSCKIGAAMRLITANYTLWFSYSTPIAIQNSDGLFIRENDWGPTTGRHLNYIDEDKSIRISGEEFVSKMNAIL